MRTKLPQSVRARLARVASRAAVAVVTLLTLMLPVGAIPAEKGVGLLHRAVAMAPALRSIGRGEDFWHVDGNRILDASNREMRIAGVNWSGFETRRGVPGGLTQQDYRAILHTIKAQGNNTVRLPLSNEMLESPLIPSEIAFTSGGEAINADLDGLNSLQILDKVVAAAGSIGLKVILDDHRSEAGDSAEASGLWYTPEYPEQAWIADWVMLAQHFRANSTVIGMDLRNEPHNATTNGACWDCGGARDWHLAAERAGDAVLRANPKLLIFVEGVDSYAGEGSWWGGNLMGVRRSPVRLAVPNRLVYSAHVYGPAEYQQTWFNESTSAASLRTLWRRQWAYVSESGVAPVWIGEFGTPNSDDDVRSAQPGSEGQWFSEFVRFLHEESNLQWTYWGINGEDRYGLLDAHYGPQPANKLKAEMLASIQAGHLGDERKSFTSSSLARNVHAFAAVPRPASQGLTIVAPVAKPPSVTDRSPAVAERAAAAADASAAAAREEIEHTFFSPAAPTGATQAPHNGVAGQLVRREPVAAAPTDARQRKGGSGAEGQVHTAEASDVQQAISAAMRATAAPK